MSLVATEMNPQHRRIDLRSQNNRLAKTFTDKGTVTYINEEIMDPKTGSGLLWDTWRQDPIYRYGKPANSKALDYNGCNNLVRCMLYAMKVPMNNKINRVYRDNVEYSARDPIWFQAEVKLGFYNALTVDLATGRSVTPELYAFRLDQTASSSGSNVNEPPDLHDSWAEPSPIPFVGGPADVVSNPDDDTLGNADP